MAFYQIQCASYVLNPLNDSSLPPLLCVCNPGFDGASDFYDLRAAQNADGAWLSYSCPNSLQGTVVAWSLFLVALLMRQALNIYSFTTTVVRSNNHSGGSNLVPFYRRMPFRVLIIDGFIATPLLILVCALKLAPDPQVIGTNVLITVAMSLGFTLWIIVWADYTNAQFFILVSARMTMGEGTPGRHLIRIYLAIAIVQPMLYFIFNASPTIAMLFLNKSLGPSANDQAALLVARNVGLFIWNFSVYSGFWVTMSELKTVQIKDSSSDHQGSPIQSNKGVTKAVRVIGFLKEQQVRTLKQLVIYTLVSAIFTLPWFWGKCSGNIAYITLCFILLLTQHLHLCK